MIKFVIRIVVIVVKDRDAVIDVKSKRVNTVVNYHNVTQVLLEYAEVFDKQPLMLDTRISEEPSLNQLLIWVQEI